MKLLLIDGANFAHRARAGFQLGPNAFMFNFFRNLRALVDLIKPDHVAYVLEGKPVARNALHSEYKANRAIAEDDPNREKKTSERDAFFTAYAESLALLQEAFPVTVVRHPTHECDDVIHNMALEFLKDPGYLRVRESTEGDEVVIVSSDTDFIQSLQADERIKLYNAMKKEWVTAPPYNYVAWKALRGDGSDNIPGIPGVGDKTAAKLVSGNLVENLKPFFDKDPGRAEVFERNTNLIRFHAFSDEDWGGVTVRFGKADWTRVRQVFEGYGFASILKDKTWEKFTTTFDAASRQ